ncbi:HD family phosphohydrolase [Legionella maioricensis]|uniref:HD domain-containing protein n=1 Tax=Legionella maioricensis TaxID=2896528 RepID=A0A9X2ID41_9GAMM|nr:HD family phosphohydrolase [Legionella maioricensis]MCL9685147.1 HD domain-containing protein [Legionella maioricensis]MCL9688340.1 HD domain-containing protein [Legionella maioricensis]
MKLTEAQFTHLLKALTDIGIALSAEKDHNRLLEIILKKAQEITHADGGTLYTCTEDAELKFEIMINQSMGIHLGGTSDKQVNFKNLPLYDEKGKPNDHMLAPWAAVSRQTINIKDAYNNKKFDLSGTKNFDKNTGYHSQSFLTVPMTNHLNEVIGVLQLINALDKTNNNIIPFSKLDQYIVESLASQAAVTITNRQLIETQKELFDALIQLIAQAIDEKSPYTGGHCRRVPILTRMIALATCQIDKGPLKDFSMTEDELYELQVAAWLHDCGKITTPEAVVDKATKLERIMDGVHLIDTRFEVLKRDAIIQALQSKLQQTTGNLYNLQHDNKLQEQLAQLNTERELIRESNLGSEQIHPQKLKSIQEIAKRRWIGPSGTEEDFLSKMEILMLEINKGTLSNKERDIINNHVSMTLKMLESLPYPKNLKNVPQLAGSHHEKMDGTGYPRGLTKDQMSLQARMIAIADIFEALTASDRPYKKAMPLSQALSILGKMKVEGHIDPDLFDVFMHAKIYEHYAEEYLDRAMYDAIDFSKIPGYTLIK